METRRRFVKNVEQVYDETFRVKNCISCQYWKDKKDLYGENWGGTYSGKCTKNSVETPPIYVCSGWLPKGSTLVKKSK